MLGYAWSGSCHAFAVAEMQNMRMVLLEGCGLN